MPKSPSGPVVQFPVGSSMSTLRTQRARSTNDTTGTIPKISQSLVPFGPSLFTPPFDVITELTRNRDQYAAYDRENRISINYYPTAVKLSIDSLRSRTPNSPGVGVALACCTYNGIAALSRDPSVCDLIHYRKRPSFLIGENAKGNDTDFEEVITWFEHFNIALPDGSGSRFTILFSERLKKAIASLADDLGKIPQSRLVILAVMMTLVTQPNILDKHRQDMKASIDKFFRRVYVRCRIAKTLLEIVDPETL